MTRRSVTAPRIAAALTSAVASAALLVACTSGSSGHADSTDPGVATPTTPVTPAATSSAPTAPSTTLAPSDIDRPANTAPVIRNGVTPRPTVSARPATLAGGTRVTYPDGVSLQILSITQASVAADGSKTIAGPKTTFSLRFRNGSAKSIAMNQVVVSAIYGSRNLAARPVYDDTDSSLHDFSGTVRPRGSASAAYAFSVPTAQLGRVTLRVDFDAVHVVATFTGRVRAR